MNTKLIRLFFLLLSTFIYSQTEKDKINLTANDKLIYLDSLGAITDETNHLYFRIIKDYKLDRGSYEIFDYYKSGALLMGGVSSNKHLLLKNGLFAYYYENGNKKGTANYVNNVQEGEEIKWYKNGAKQSVKNFKKGKLDGFKTSWYENGNQMSTSFYERGGVNGKVTEWYKNGNKRSEIEYYFVTTNTSATSTNKRTEVKINQFWDENGVQKVIDGNGDYEEEAKGYYATGKVRNGNKDGNWTGKYLDFNYSFSETYTGNKMISGVGVDKDNMPHKYTEIRANAMPKDGMNDFNNYIAKSLVTYKNDGLPLKIFVQVEIEVDGSVVDVKILRDSGNGIGEEAIKAIKSYKGWSSAKLRGRNVRGFFTTLIGV